MTTLTDQLEGTAFHDSSLAEVASVDQTIIFSFEDVKRVIPSDEFYTATVILNGVHEIKKFDAPVPAFTMISEDAEVLQFHRGTGKATLIVNWCFYQPSVTVFEKYEFYYDTSAITAERQGNVGA